MKFRGMLSTTCLVVAAMGCLARVGPGDIVPPRAREVETASKTPRFRRVFVPENEVDAWPRNGLRYIPMERTRFEQLADGLSRSTLPPARLTRAEYDATLENDVLRGTGRWTVEAADGGGTIDLESVSLAIAGFRHEADTAKATLETTQAGPFLAVDGPTAAAFNWSARGETRPDGSIAFDLRFPRCLLTGLTLTLPPGYRIESDSGIGILESDDARQTVRRLELGGRLRCRLVLVPPGVLRAPTVISPGESSFAVSAKGIGFSAEWTVRFASGSDRFFTLAVDEGLRLTQIDLDRQPCTWTQSPPKEGRCVVRVRVPDNVLEGEATLNLEGIAAPASGRSGHLPRARIRDESHDGETVQLKIDPPLTATRIVPTGAIQTRWTTLPAPERGELFEFFAFAADWTLELETEFPSPRIATEEAISLQFSPGEVQSRVKTLFQATQGRLFTVEANVAPRWIIESVRADLADAVEDWSVEPGRRGRDQKLVVQLARPLTAKRPLELTVFARRLYSQRRKAMSIAEMRPLTYTIAEPERRVLSLRATGDVQLRTGGEEMLTRIDPGGMENERFASFLRSSGTLVFLDDARAESLRVALRKRVPRFSTKIETEARITGETLTETTAIRCTPDATRIERLLILFSQPRDEPVSWAFTDGKKTKLEAQELDADAKASLGAPLEGELWEIVLGAPRSVPFEIRASRSVAVEGDVSVSLAWLPEARSGEAFVTVLADRGRAPTIVSSSLEPTVPAAVPPGRYRDARAVFSYNYRDLDFGGLVVRGAASDTSEHPAWAWEAEIDSEFAPSGRANHTVRYLLENTGAPAVSVVLPRHIAASQVREVRLDGSEVAWDAARSEKRLKVSVPLPPGEKYVRLQISFDASCPELGLCGRVEIPDLKPDFDVLKTAWIVRFAPGYLPIAGPGAHPGICHRLASLMGPFAARWTTTRPKPFFDSEARIASLAGVDSSGAAAAGFDPTPAQSDRKGWTPFRFRPTSDGRNKLTVVHRPRMDALGYAALLATVGLGIGVFRSARAFWFSGVGACLITVLLVPPAFFGIVSGVFLGCLGVAVSGLFRDTSRQSGFETGPANSVPPGSRRLVGLLLACVFLGVPTATADEPNTGKPADRSQESTVYPILIPFGKDSVKGDSKEGDPEEGEGRVLVPEPLYRELHRRNLGGRGDSPITILSASYDCELTWSVDEEDLVPREWRLRYDVINRARSAELVLPIKSTEGVIRPDGVRIDGRLTPWRTANGIMRVPIGEPGNHRVELLVRPKVLTSDGTHVAAVGVPPVPSAEVTVTTPTNGPRVAVTSALGETRRDRRTGKTRALLGPATSLVLTWKRSRPAGGAEFDNANSRGLLWLRIAPRSVRLSARLSIQGLSPETRVLELTSNANLRLADSGSDETIVWRRRRAGAKGGSLFEVTAKEGFGRPAILEGRFELENALGIRRIEIPRLAPSGIPVSQTWLAVSVDPRLDVSEAGTSESISVGEFVAAWGETESRPDFVIRLDNGNPRFIEARLRDEPLQVDQEAVYEFDAESVRMRFRAEIDAPSPRFSHRLRLSEAAHIETLSVHQQDVQRSVRWSRDSQGTVNVFLGEAVAGKHSLTFTARIDVPASRKINVPVPALVDAEPRESHLLLARRFGAEIRILEEIGCTPMEVSAQRAAEISEARLVRAYRADGKSPELRIAVNANAPVIEAGQIVAPYFEDGAARLAVDVWVLPRTGVVDEIALRLSEDVGELVRMTPAEPHTFRKTRDEGRLVIRPKEPIAGPWRGRLIFRLRAAAGGGLTLGRVELIPSDVGEIRVLERLVVLPTRHLETDLTWERRHLRPIAFPKDYAWPGLSSDSVKAYEIGSDAYEAVLVRRDVPKGMAMVRFADVRLAVEGTRTYGVALYDVEPAGYSECPLAIPPGCELVRAFVSGIPAQPVPGAIPKSLVGEARYSLPLASQTKPQRVTLVFETRTPDDAPTGTVTYPRLAYLPVQNGIVTFRLDEAAKIDAGDAAPLSTEEADLLRLRALTGLIRAGATTVGTPKEPDLRWFATWGKRLVALARRLDPVVPEAKTRMDQVHGFARRWKQEDLWNEICVQSQTLFEPGDAWNGSAGRENGVPRKTIRLPIPKNAAYGVQITQSDEPRDFTPLRYLLAAVSAVVIVSLMFAVRGHRPPGWFLYPHFVGVLIGILWFVFLRPEIVGLVAMGLFTLASLRPAWRWSRV